MPLTLVTPPQALPVNLDDFRDHLRIGTRTREDALLQRLLETASSRAERELRRALITQAWKQTASAFPCGSAWRIPKPPLKAITSVQYMDATGALATMASGDYVTVAPAGPNPTHGTLVLGDGKAWPTPGINHPEVAQVTFTAGYGDKGTDVPDDIRHGILLLAAHLYELREPVQIGTIATPVPMTVEYLWAPYRALVWG